MFNTALHTANYQQEQQQRLNDLPLSELSQRLSPELSSQATGVTALSSPRYDLIRGLVFEDVHMYQSVIHARATILFCEHLVLPSYSSAKSIFAV